MKSEDITFFWDTLICIAERDNKTKMCINIIYDAVRAGLTQWQVPGAHHFMRLTIQAHLKRAQIAAKIAFGHRPKRISRSL